MSKTAGKIFEWKTNFAAKLPEISQKQHFDHEKFLILNLQNFRLLHFLLQFSSNPQPYGFLIFKQILNPKPPNRIFQNKNNFHFKWKSKKIAKNPLLN